MGFASPEYGAVKQVETDEQRRERIRLWYVALTRARDLLLLPLQTERSKDDWLGLLTLDLQAIPKFDAMALLGTATRSVETVANDQDLVQWQAEAAAIVANEKTITWRMPSRHEGLEDFSDSQFGVFSGPDAVSDQPPLSDDGRIQGGRERGIILHKLMEEILTGETPELEATIAIRAAVLLKQLGLVDNDDPANGLSSKEMAGRALAGLQIPEISALRPQLRAEVPVYGFENDEQAMVLTSGIADAVAIDENGKIFAVVDWKSDVQPSPKVIDLYRMQVRDYLKATGAKTGVIVFLTSGQVEKIEQ